MKEKIQYSLKRDLLKPYIIVILISIVLYCGLFISRNNLSQNMEQITANNLQISQLSLLIPKRQNQTEAMEEVESVNMQISEIIGSVQSMCENPTSNFLVYSRIVEQINGYYVDCMNHYLTEDTNSQMHYYSGAHLRTISDELKKYVNLLMAEYLNYSYVTFNQSMEQYKILELQINLVLVLFVFACLIYMVLLSRRIWKFLSSVCSYTGHLADHKWNTPDLDEGRYREFNIVVKALNGMKGQINNYIVEIQEKNEIERQLHEEQLSNEKNQRMLKEASLQMLQMQINPHFLFNTLNLIMRTVQMQQNQTAVELIKATAQILRSSISTRSQLIPLWEEISNVESYLCIQRLRYQERIVFQTGYQDSDIRNQLIPPMILQPLVENAILHGLKDKSKDGSVVLTVRELEGILEIHITDNGVGFSCEQLESIEKETTERIGLLNVKKRLRMQFPDCHGFEIKSEPGNGAEIIIRIPAGERSDTVG